MECMKATTMVGARTILIDFHDLVGGQKPTSVVIDYNATLSKLRLIPDTCIVMLIYTARSRESSNANCSNSTVNRK